MHHIDRRFFFVILSMIITVILIFPQAKAIAQAFSTDILVNHLLDGDQETDESGALAINGDNVYVVWSDTDSQRAYVSRSLDGGETFNEGVQVSEDAGQFFPSIAVNEQGVVCVTWTMVDMETETISGIAFAQSMDGGVTFSSSTVVSEAGGLSKIAVDGNNVYIFYMDSEDFTTADFYFSRSFDGGTTFQPSYQVNDAVEYNARFEDMSDIFVDDSGTIYVAWNDGRLDNGGVNVFLASSQDNGTSFGPNVPVNSLDGAQSENMHFGPAIRASGSMVYVAWRNETVEEAQRIMFARSLDGGATFGPEITLHESMWKSPDIALGIDGDIYVTAASGMGVYCVRSSDDGVSFNDGFTISDIGSNDVKNPSIAIDDDNTLHAVWNDFRNGSKDIYFSSGNVVTTLVSKPDEHPINQIFEHGNYPNPFNASTTIRYELTSSAPITITVFNSLGQTVSTFNMGLCLPGIHEYVFDALSLTSGMYFYRVDAGYSRATGKMLYMK